MLHPCIRLAKVVFQVIPYSFPVQAVSQYHENSVLANVAASWGDLLGDQLLQDFPLPNPVLLKGISEENVHELILPTFLI